MDAMREEEGICYRKFGKKMEGEVEVRNGYLFTGKNGSLFNRK